MLLLSWLIPGNAFFEGSEYCSCNLQRAASIYYYDAQRRDRARGCCKKYCDNVITERSNSEGFFASCKEKGARTREIALATQICCKKNYNNNMFLKKSRIRPKAFPIKNYSFNGGSNNVCEKPCKKENYSPQNLSCNIDTVWLLYCPSLRQMRTYINLSCSIVLF